MKSKIIYFLYQIGSISFIAKVYDSYYRLAIYIVRFILRRKNYVHDAYLKGSYDKNYFIPVISDLDFFIVGDVNTKNINDLEKTFMFLNFLFPILKDFDFHNEIESIFLSEFGGLKFLPEENWICLKGKEYKFNYYFYPRKFYIDIITEIFFQFEWLFKNVAKRKVGGRLESLVIQRQYDKVVDLCNYLNDPKQFSVRRRTFIENRRWQDYTNEEIIVKFNSYLEKSLLTKNIENIFFNENNSINFSKVIAGEYYQKELSIVQKGFCYQGKFLNLSLNNFKLFYYTGCIDSHITYKWSQGHIDDVGKIYLKNLYYCKLIQGRYNLKHSINYFYENIEEISNNADLIKSRFYFEKNPSKSFINKNIILLAFDPYQKINLKDLERFTKIKQVEIIYVNFGTQPIHSLGHINVLNIKCAVGEEDLWNKNILHSLGIHWCFAAKVITLLDRVESLFDFEVQKDITEECDFVIARDSSSISAGQNTWSRLNNLTLLEWGTCYFDKIIYLITKRKEESLFYYEHLEPEFFGLYEETYSYNFQGVKSLHEKLNNNDITAKARSLYLMSNVVEKDALGFLKPRNLEYFTVRSHLENNISSPYGLLTIFEKYINNKSNIRYYSGLSVLSSFGSVPLTIVEDKEMSISLQAGQDGDGTRMCLLRRIPVSQSLSSKCTKLKVFFSEPLFPGVAKTEFRNALNNQFYSQNSNDPYQRIASIVHAPNDSYIYFIIETDIIPEQCLKIYFEISESRECISLEYISVPIAFSNYPNFVGIHNQMRDEGLVGINAYGYENTVFLSHAVLKPVVETDASNNLKFYFESNIIKTNVKVNKTIKFINDHDRDEIIIFHIDYYCSKSENHVDMELISKNTDVRYLNSLVKNAESGIYELWVHVLEGQNELNLTLTGFFGQGEVCDIKILDIELVKQRYQAPHMLRGKYIHRSDNLMLTTYQKNIGKVNWSNSLGFSLSFQGKSKNSYTVFHDVVVNNESIEGRYLVFEVKSSIQHLKEFHCEVINGSSSLSFEVDNKSIQGAVALIVHIEPEMNYLKLTINGIASEIEEVEYHYSKKYLNVDFDLYPLSINNSKIIWNDVGSYELVNNDTLKDSIKHKAINIFSANSILYFPLGGGGYLEEYSSDNIKIRTLAFEDFKPVNTMIDIPDTLKAGSATTQLITIRVKPEEELSGESFLTLLEDIEGSFIESYLKDYELIIYIPPYFSVCSFLLNCNLRGNLSYDFNYEISKIDTKEESFEYFAKLEHGKTETPFTLYNGHYKIIIKYSDRLSDSLSLSNLDKSFILNKTVKESDHFVFNFTITEAHKSSFEFKSKYFQKILSIDILKQDLF